MKRRKFNDKNRRIYVNNENLRADIKGYTRLKDNILFLNSNGENKVIQVESSIEHECKTTVACNLAVSLGLTEKKVVLVDLDFRCPKAHMTLNEKNGVGICEYMAGSIDKDKLIKKTAYENVDLITRGGEIYNPSIVLISEKFKNLILGLKKEYDFVILDCPPVLLVSDYVHISKVSDGVLLLAAYSQTLKSQIVECSRQLKNNGIKILGSVFTMYDPKQSKYYSYGDNHSYGKE